jgi:hypothetical protein
MAAILALLKREPEQGIDPEEISPPCALDVGR